MTFWLLLGLTLFFAYLTYDSWVLRAPPLPYSEIAKGFGQDLDHLQLHEQEKLNRYPNRIRLGDINQSTWLFGILTFGLALATANSLIG
jgi:hypothetical protein